MTANGFLNKRTGKKCLTIIDADMVYNVAKNEFPLITTRKVTGNLQLQNFWDIFVMIMQLTFEHWEQRLGMQMLMRTSLGCKKSSEARER